MCSCGSIGFREDPLGMLCFPGSASASWICESSLVVERPLISPLYQLGEPTGASPTASLAPTPPASHILQASAGVRGHSEPWWTNRRGCPILQTDPPSDTTCKASSLQDLRREMLRLKAEVRRNPRHDRKLQMILSTSRRKQGWGKTTRELGPSGKVIQSAVRESSLG